MPQEKIYTIDLDDSTTIEFNPDMLPTGFDTLQASEKKAILHKIVKDSMTLHEEKTATASDILLPLVIVFTIALLILFIAKKIRKNPKLYDTIVKVDGKPNPEFGKDWPENK